MSRNGSHAVALPDDRLPPANLEAELGVLGAILLDNDVLHDVVPLLEAEDFFRDSHQVLYRAIRDLYRRGVPVDAITLMDHLRQEPGRYERVGGDDALAEVLRSVPHAANAAYHARIVRQKAIVRELIQGAHETLRDGYAQRETAADMFAAAQRRLLATADRLSDGGAVGLRHHVVEAMGRMARRQAGECDALPTGFLDLDALIGGFDPGNMAILGARPSIGKTACALNVCDNLAFGLSIPVLFLSIEMPGWQLAWRLLVAQARVDGARARGARGLDAAAMAAIGRAYDRLVSGEDALRIDDTPMQSVAAIEARVRLEVARRRPELVVIDHFHLIQSDPSMGRANEQERLTDQSKRIKALARDTGIPVLLLCQLNRLAEGREDRRPRMSDLRGTGSLEQDADLILLLHRPEFYDPADQPGVAEMIVAKNRNGATGTVRLSYAKAQTRFGDLAPAHYGDDWRPQDDGD
jgi:replicative DNA helicase